jgi:hypothetical protein
MFIGLLIAFGDLLLDLLYKEDNYCRTELSCTWRTLDLSIVNGFFSEGIDFLLTPF